MATLNKADLKLSDKVIGAACSMEITEWEMPLDDSISFSDITGAELRDLANAATDKALRGVAEWLRGMEETGSEGFVIQSIADTIEAALAKE